MSVSVAHERAIDYRAIQALYFAYARGTDATSETAPDDMVALFTEDARWEMEGSGRVQEGSAALREQFARQSFAPPTHHFITNLMVDFADDGLSARSTAYVYFHGFRRPRDGQERGPLVRNTIRYDNSHRKVGGRWLFDSVLVKYQYGV